jgi:hypothetical protein
MNRASSLTNILIIAAVILAAALGGYIGGYYLMADRASLGDVTLHIYEGQWQADCFKPAAKIESLLTGREVTTTRWICNGR